MMLSCGVLLKPVRFPYQHHDRVRAAWRFYRLEHPLNGVTLEESGHALRGDEG